MFKKIKDKYQAYFKKKNESTCHERKSQNTRSKGSSAISWNFCSLSICMKFSYVNILHLSNTVVVFHWKETNSFVINDYTTGVGYPMLLPSCALEYTVPLVLSCK